MRSSNGPAGISVSWNPRSQGNDAQLANVSLAELAKLHGVGPKALRLLQEALEQQGMSLS